ncbi:MULTISPECIES: hypothetical protein [unclassified Chryseobacterium]|uniref:hypothetical protein n=1 Tax=unclassified Chryseobacterium TaxID=2593645 RepID=UPI0013B3E64B|nr:MULTISPECIES: hypothetical protein [unclassified Chryseobacterium]MDQ1856007.1 hypothetical protein [Chryseobacterium sp. WLY505]
MNDLLTIAIVTASVVLFSYLMTSLRTNNNLREKLLLQPKQMTAIKTKVLHILFKRNLRHGKITFKHQNHRR